MILFVEKKKTKLEEKNLKVLFWKKKNWKFFWKKSFWKKGLENFFKKKLWTNFFLKIFYWKKKQPRGKYCLIVLLICIILMSSYHSNVILSIWSADVILSLWYHSIILMSLYPEQGRVKFDSGLFHITTTKTTPC